MATASAVIGHPGRLELIDRARARSDELFALVDASLYFLRPIPLRHRLIFYLGHLEAFDVNHLLRWNLKRPPLDPVFEVLFERGIDPAPGEKPSDTPEDWPAVDRVAAYARAARAAVDAAIADADEDMVQLIVEHRFMHCETLAYMLHELPHQAKTRPPAPPSASRHRPSSNAAITIPAGNATLGRKPGEGFGWDNEFQEHRVAVASFAIDRYKVTNRRYLKFVEETAVPPPHFWERRGGEWFWRGMFESYPLPPEAPVYVTHREATAYAAWLGRRLPTEAEFHRAAFGTPDGGERSYPWGEEPPTAERSYADFAGFDPIDVSATPLGDSAFGVAQTLGNGWEWTSTTFQPFPGFEPLPNYPGYSADFFDGAHFVLKGGSPRTAACFLRRSFRNWFRPDYPYLYATFRCVQST